MDNNQWSLGDELNDQVQDGISTLEEAEPNITYGLPSTFLGDDHYLNQFKDRSEIQEGPLDLWAIFQETLELYDEFDVNDLINSEPKVKFTAYTPGL